MNIPTLNKMVKVYLVSAEVERLKCGRPGKGTVRNTLLGVKRFRRWINARREQLGQEYIGFDEDFPRVSIIKPPLIHKYLADMLKSGTNPLTAMTYLSQLQQLFAKWMRPYYEDHGWKVPPFPSIGTRPTAPRYNRPPSDQLAKVKRWYEGLSAECRDSARCEEQSAEAGEGKELRTPHSALSTHSLWFVTTMMLEFAMRNSDIMRLKRENFVEYNGRIFLNYKPNKTAHSSGRVVKWPVHENIWKQMLECGTRSSEFGDWQLPDFTEDVFRDLNKQMRGLGFSGPKGAYELRKICIDHVYQKFGAEMAVSISGDNIKTIIHYYADPAQPNIGNIRITDLL